MTKHEIKAIEYAFFNYKKLMDSVVISTVEWAESGFLIKNSQDRYIHNTKVRNEKGNYHV